MMSSAKMRALSAVLASTTILTLSACSSNGSTRFASVGQIPPGSASGGGSGGTGSSDSGGTGGNGLGSGSGTVGNGTGGPGLGGSDSGPEDTGGGSSVSSAGTGLLVTAGNAVIGVASQHNAVAETVSHILPGTQPVTGTVTAILQDTGQTLVDLGNGQSVAVQSAAGIVGEIVRIDLANLKVVGAPDNSSLLGVGIATAQPVTGTLAGLNVLTGNNAVGGLVDHTTAAVVAVIAPGSTIPAQVDQAIAPVVTTVVGVVNQATAGLGSGDVASVVNTAGSTVLQAAGDPGGAVTSVVTNVTGAASPVGTVVPVVQTAVNAVVPVVQGTLDTVAPVVQNVLGSGTAIPGGDGSLGSLPTSAVAAVGAVVGVTGQASVGSPGGTGPAANAGIGGVLGLGALLGTQAH